MSKKREFPILNGKLISDLDANGHEIKRLRLTQDQVVDVIKLVGVVLFVEDAKGNKTAVTIGIREAGKPVGKHSLANGYEVTASGEHAHAEGCSTTAAGDYSHAEGFYAHTKEQDIYAFVWNGDGMRFAPYESHGSGTFNINPFGGLDGFYIGEQTLPQVINAVIADAQIDSKINTIIADDAGKSARTIAAEEVAKVVADAPADFDTLKEIAEYIESDKTGAAQMVTKIDANANAISAEAQRAQEAEAALRGTVEGKADKVANATSGNLVAIGNDGNLVDSCNMVAGAFTAGSFIGGSFIGGGSGLGFELNSTDKWVELYINLPGGFTLKFPLHGDTLAVQDDIAPTFDETGTYDEGALVFHDGLYRCVNPNGHTGEWLEADFSMVTVEDVLAALREAVAKKVDAVEGKGLSTNDYTTEDKAKLGTAYTPDNPPPAPDLSGYATKAEVEQVQGSVNSVWSALYEVNNKADAALPRYQFTSAGISDGVVTIPPYVYAGMLSDGTAFTVAVGEGNGYMRDCILIVECGDVAPTITWPANFHPRTDAETDFACVAGVNNVHVNNVYWISEYVQGEFVVAGWQATAGGSAQ